MSSDTNLHALLDPDMLYEDAKALLHAPETTPSDERTPLEKSIRRAHQQLAADLATIERTRGEGAEPSYAELFGAQCQEKIAAIIFLIKHKLLDIAGNSLPTRDLLDTRRDITRLVDILFKLQAMEGLGILYDFANSQAQGELAQFWQRVALHYLHLMALLPPARPQVLHFLSERPDARRQVEQLMASTDDAIARTFRALGEDYVRAKHAEETESPAPAEYTICYRQYDQRAPDACTAGLSSLLAAQDSIRHALAAGETAALLSWFAEGSQRAVRYLLHSARASMSASALMDFLIAILATEKMDPVRLAAAVLGMGDINRTLRDNGGEPNINQQLVEATMTTDGARAGVARLAVRELSSVNAFNELLTVVERAPIIEVAEEAIIALRDLRRLVMAETIVSRRPLLQTTYHKAQKHLQEIQNLTDAAWACQNEHMAMPYIMRLKELQATRELEVLGQKHKQIGHLATSALSALRLELAGGGNGEKTR